MMKLKLEWGIHGEPGIKREKLKPADAIVDDLFDRIIKDAKLKNKDEISVMINSLGATPLEELYIVSKRVNENLLKINIQNKKVLCWKICYINGNGWNVYYYFKIIRKFKKTSFFTK